MLGYERIHYLARRCLEDDWETRLKELKKRLAAEGFQVFRTQQAEIVLADRVRDNLIMDSGVRVLMEPQGRGYLVRCVLRSQRSDHPADTDEDGLSRARELSGALCQSGYCEVEERISRLADPNAPGSDLDVWRELVLQKQVPDWAGLVAEVRHVLSLPKLA